MLDIGNQIIIQYPVSSIQYQAGGGYKLCPKWRILMVEKFQAGY
jgi:hypothetical protein